ncbi:MAG: formate dehydrogenase accessory sulfurtransferase FdhD [Opitutales bacterium]
MPGPNDRPADAVRAVRIRRWAEATGTVAGDEDVVAAEEPCELRIEYSDTKTGLRVGRILAVTMRTPGADAELIRGFLLTEGLLPEGGASLESVNCGDPGDPQTRNRVTAVLAPGLSVDSKRLERNFYMTSSCGVCGKASLEALKFNGCPVLPKGEPVWPAAVLRGLPDALRDAQAAFVATGGIHAAGLFDAAGDCRALREDVGRHNAVDKVIGHALTVPEITLSASLLMVSGRSSFEILQKALAAGIPAVAAIGAPSSLAVETATAFGSTLIGFLRHDRFNIYAGPERVGS